MHELSIADQIIRQSCEHAQQEGAVRVISVRVRIGVLACVQPNALQFCFAEVAEGTMLEGAALEIMTVPIALECKKCQREFELAGIQPFLCPRCGTPSADLVRGNELEIESLAVMDLPTCCDTLK